MHWWENYPLRMIQTNLREIDMEDICAEKFVRDLKEFGANAVTINVGGIVASYDTEIEYQPQSQYLHGDSLETVVEECHKAGIKVIARMDFTKIDESVYEKHPDWAYRAPNGQIVSDSGKVHSCLNSPYQQKYAMEILKEILNKIKFDGVFCNMSGFISIDYRGVYHGPCHCESCRRQFKEKYGEEIPAWDNPQDPVYRKYSAFRAECSQKQKAQLYRTIRDISQEIAIEGLDYNRTESHTEIGAMQWVYNASSNCRKISGGGRNLLFDGAVTDFMGFRYRDTSVSPAQMELRQWQNLANAGTTSLYIMGRLDNHKDVSCYEGTKRVFRFFRDHEELYTHVTSAAEVMLIHRNMMGRCDEETSGWIRALTESHIPFDEMKLAALKNVEQLNDKKIVILGDAKNLSAAQAEILDAFAENGGALLVTGDTGYSPRTAELALKCMGVKKVLEKKTGLMSSVFLVDVNDKQTFPHCEQAPYIAFGEELVTAEFKETTEKYLKLIPEHPFGPPEVCYYTEMPDYPGITVHPYGKGKGVYMPWMAGAFYFTEGYQNTLNIMQDVLFNLCGAKDIAPGLTPMAEVNLCRKEEMKIVQLVNTTGCFANSFFPPVPLHGVCIELDGLSGDREVKAYNGGAVSCESIDGKLVVTLDKLEAYEIITVK